MLSRDPSEWKKWDMNSVLQSEVTWPGAPCFENTWVRNSQASWGASTMSWVGMNSVMVCLVCLVRLVRMPLTISNHLQLHLPTLRCRSDAHCVSSHNHATPVARLNSDQCLISPDFVPMSRATTYLSFSPYAAFA